MGKHELVWAGETMRRVMAQIDRVAASQTRVCIYGETGTGKELVARTLHQKSPRADGPFVTLNCAAIPAELIESELFGHEKGSFTGAAQRLFGKFEQAHRGTLFLDEIGDMPLAMQAKLLRVLEEGEVERIGGSKPMPVDVRVLVATHRDLEALVRDGDVSPGPVSPRACFPDSAAAAARPQGGYSAAGRAFRAAGVRAERLEAGAVYGGGGCAHCRAMRGRGISASCAIWWSGCCCWRETRWIERLSIWRCRRRTLLAGSLERTMTGPLADRVAGF